MGVNNIKFKAKRIDNNEWVEGYFYKVHNNNYIMRDNVTPAKLVDPSTVCQYTGLKDENGKDVWEHDIIAVPVPLFKGEIIFSGGCFRVKSDDDSSFPFTNLLIIDDKIDYCRVIGNKFDKKE